MRPARSGKAWLARMAAISVGGVLAFVAISLGPDLFLAAVEEPLRRRMGLWGLWAMLFAYAGAVAVGPLLVAGSLARLGMMRRPRGREATRRAFAGLSLGLSLVLGLALAELGATAYLNRAYRLPDLPEAPRAETDEETIDPDDAEGPRSASSSRPIALTVIGESSAKGEPYDPDLSVGQIVAWQLERVFPGRRFEVDMQAEPGITLELAIERFRHGRRRPDAILVYAGHNEFQGRYSWSRSVAHYRNDPLVKTWSPIQAAARVSSVCLMIDAAMERHRLSFAPPKQVTRGLVDVPTCTPGEYDGIVRDFRRRLDGLFAYAHRIDVPLMAVIPPGNDEGDPPCRSYLDPSTTPEGRAAFAAEFESTRALEADEPDAAAAGYRRLLGLQPLFAEAHYRLGKLLEARGDYAEADAHFIRARDLDGLPMRCPSPLQDVYRELAEEWPEAVLVDGPKVLRAVEEHGLVGDALIHDMQHPTLRAYVAIAQKLLEGLREKKAFGWPDGTPAPRIDVAECADHFGVDAALWSKVCRRAASFYDRTAHIRYDPTGSLAKAARLQAAAAAIESGTPPGAVGVPGVGVPESSR